MTEDPIGWRLTWNYYARRINGATQLPPMVADYRTQAEAEAHKARLAATAGRADLVASITPVFISRRERGQRRALTQADAAGPRRGGREQYESTCRRPLAPS